MPYCAETSERRPDGRRLGQIVGLIGLVLMAFMSREGLAAEPPQEILGQLNAVAGAGHLPFGKQVTIEPGSSHAEFGNAPLYIAVRKVVERELAHRGFRAGATSHLILSFRIDITGFHTRRRQTSDPFPEFAPPSVLDYARSPVVHQFVVPLGERSHQSPSRTSITMVLFKPGEPPLWRATVFAATLGNSAETVVSRMSMAAMGAFGMTAKRDLVLKP